MMAPLTQEVFEPKTVEEALKVLAENGADAAVIAGGTDLLVRVKDGVVRPKAMVDILGLPLNYVKGSRTDGFTVGSTTTAAELRANAQVQTELPVLYEAAKHLGGPQTQEMATVGGNICNASPCGNFSNVLLSLDARIKLAGPDGEREVTMDEFFLGVGKTAIAETELMTEIVIPPISNDSGLCYIKHVLRREMDIAVVGVAVMIVPDGGKIASARIALGSVGPKPFLAEAAQAVLEGKQYSDQLAEQAAEAAQKEASYIDDVRASADYRKKLTYTLVKNAIAEAWANSKGGK